MPIGITAKTVRPIPTSPASGVSYTIHRYDQHQTLDKTGLQHSVCYKKRQLRKCYRPTRVRPQTFS